MELYVYDHNLELAGIIDTASSVIWHRRYYTFGDFEIHVPAGTIEIALIQKQYIITKPNAVEFGIIEYITIEQGEDGDFIKAVGRFGSSLLARRIIFETTVLNTTVENAMRTIVYDNAINPTITDRIIPNLELGDLNSFTETVSFQVTYRNLANTLKSLAETSGISYRVIFDPVAKKFKFETYKALDRSIEQSTNPRSIFSNDYDNLLTSIYQTSDMDYSNVALVGGEGEGIERELVVVGSASGLDRYEVFVNAKEIQMEDGITEPEYFAMLAQKGAESLLPKVENFEGNVLTEGTLRYKEDYDLGDIVTIENTKWNKRISVQITEITEVDDDNGFQVIPVFGVANQTLKESLSGTEDTSGSGGGSITVTPNRVIVSDAEGKAIASDITSTELGYLDGVTSSIQTQLNSKQENITGAASTIASNNLTANRGLISDANGKVAASNLIQINNSENGIAFGKASELSDYLENALPTLFYNGLFVENRKVRYLLNNQDCNEIIDEWSLGAGTNYPTSAYWYVNTVFYSDESQLKQIAYGYVNNEVWTRYRYQGAWSNWVRFLNTENNAYIQESGSNANGNYIQFSDGTCICWGEVTINKTLAVLVAPIHWAVGTITFPLTITEVRYSNVSPLRVLSGEQYGWGNVYNNGTTFMNYAVYGYNTASISKLRYIVIGRWY